MELKLRWVAMEVAHGVLSDLTIMKNSFHYITS